MNTEEKTRKQQIAAVSRLGIILNLGIAAVRIAIGLITSSVAFLTEGLNNSMDALNSVLTLIGTKLAGKHPDEKHPFGYGRVEYLTSLSVSVIIIVVGFQAMEESIRQILHPEELHISPLSLILVAATAIIKLFHGIYTIRMGKKTQSQSLVAIGLEGRNDFFGSILTIASAFVFLIFHRSIDGWTGVLLALLIIKSGIDVLKETVSELIGRPGEKELADELYRLIRSQPYISGAADMMLHNYGPESWSGSVNVEINHAKTIGEIYQDLHALQLRIMEQYHVTMVFGIYAVDNDNPESRQVRQDIASFVRETDHVISYHAVYLDRKNRKLYCDLVVDYECKDWDKLTEEFNSMIQTKHPGYQPELTVETDYI